MFHLACVGVLQIFKCREIGKAAERQAAGFPVERIDAIMQGNIQCLE